ncbi:heparan-alpha-glucosaminide N-acetyltransferase [Herbivorax sp. ANBcel31]|uniref:heparan-alpha-glucosaminide N-acetyltransferase n=1 Tax=Herbivorax sp. ANBcel31 TaxID=3069754 RepID=UPI0027ADFAC8|nr:heparan-alpha-glucosaminide N-acetyltransferase [Herbivorax sp. ANBcel31]MDQ2084893.1 heparan-alpha-glucosaminide N-acetyltransferase [Herbivorax sp. ANBcel31]
MEKISSKRIWEVDMARGILIILMIVLHILFNLEYFFEISINYSSGFTNVLRIAVASSFILISGTSTSFSRNSFKRGIIVFLTAMMITLFTYIFNREAYVLFGILHLLGICMIISPVFKKLNIPWLFILIVAIILINFIFSNLTVKSNYFFMFGLSNENFISLDYYPLLPWSSFFIAGILLSKIIYRQKKSIFSFDIKDNVINFLGRHSLFVYVVHQPVILIIMFLTMAKK